MPKRYKQSDLIPPQGTVCVYLMETGKYVKIGIAKDPDWRRTLIQNANPKEVSLELAVAFPSLEKARSVEAYLHQVYADYREYGEWFCIPLKWARHALMQQKTDDMWWCDTFPRSRRRPTPAELLEAEAADLAV